MEVYRKDVEQILCDYPGNKVVDLLWINLDFWDVKLSSILGKYGILRPDCITLTSLEDKFYLA